MNAQERFLAQAEHSNEFRKMADSISYEEATDAALLRFIETQAAAPTTADASANGYRLEGAVRMLKVLRGIADRPTIKERQPIGQLNPV